MATARLYEYAVLTAVPNPRRGERVNIGIIVFRPDRLDVRFKQAECKLRALTGDNSKLRIESARETFKRLFHPDQKASDALEYVKRVDPLFQPSGLGFEQDVETFEAYWPAGSRPRLAMSIMLYLGARRSDAVLIGKKHESRDGLSVTFAQFKGRKKGAKVLTLPILPPLRAILDASEMGRETWLETSFGKSYRVAGFGNAFRGWCTEAGLPQCTPHGLHKIGVVRAAEAGASEHELMAMFGWDDANMARIYTRKAAQKRLAASGAAKLRIVQPMQKTRENNILEGYWRPVGE